MKGDFSRFTFNPQKHYSRVLMQQGRVQLDADWNEQLDISAYRTDTALTDFIGHSGTPEKSGISGEAGGFGIAIAGEDDGDRDDDNLKVSPGRYYVAGQLYENHSEILLTEQPYLPLDTVKDIALGEGAEENDELQDGLYLAYLDVWQRHVTALEDPNLREPALAGADTATRVKNIWQVKLHQTHDSTDVDLEDLDPTNFARDPDAARWEPTWERPISLGRLKAEVIQTGNNTLENQLYRVEIHQSGTAETATFKWSRDNASLAALVEGLGADKIQIKHLGHNAAADFTIGQLVEYSYDARPLMGKPGYLARIQDVKNNILTVEWLGEGSAPEFYSPSTLRGWDSEDAANISSTAIPLEHGINITFETDEDTYYKTGDYWLIPSRHLKGDIEWERDDNSEPVFQPPRGTLHRYSALAFVKREEGKFTTIERDCRFIFRPFTSGLVNKAGDTITGSLSINESLNVDGNVRIGLPDNDFRAKLSIHGGLHVGGDSDPGNNNLLVDGSLTVRGAISLQGTDERPGLSINSDGNLGIGTLPGSKRLKVEGDTIVSGSFSVIRDSFNEAKFQFNENTSFGNNQLSTKLQISSTNSAELVLNSDIDNTDEGNHPIVTLTQDSGGVIGQLGFFGSGNKANDLVLKNLKQEDTQVSGISTLRFKYNGGLVIEGNSSDSSTSLFINGGLNVGGVSEPGDKNLIVNGDLQVKGFISFQGKVTDDRQKIIKLNVSNGLTRLEQEEWKEIEDFRSDWYLQPDQDPPAYFLDSLGILHLRGKVYARGDSWGEPIFHLDGNYNPYYPRSFVALTGTAKGGDTFGLAKVDVRYLLASNLVEVTASGGYAWVILDGISFKTRPSS